MRNFFRIFIEVVYTVFQLPGELPVYLQKIPGFKSHVIVSLMLASFSTATGVYLLRDRYSGLFLITILLLALVHMAAFLLWGFLLGTATDSLVLLRRPERPGQVWPMIGIAYLSILPFIFVLPVVLPVRLLRMHMLVLVPLLLGLFAWSAYITLQGLQYLYELPLKNALFVYARAALIVLLFPGVLTLFFFFEIFQLVS